VIEAYLLFIGIIAIGIIGGSIISWLYYKMLCSLNLSKLFANKACNKSRDCRDYQNNERKNVIYINSIYNTSHLFNIRNIISRLIKQRVSKTAVDWNGNQKEYSRYCKHDKGYYICCFQGNRIIRKLIKLCQPKKNDTGLRKNYHE